MMGEGVLIAEGDKHRAQRRLMNPAFGPGQVRELTGIFLDKANEVRTSFTRRLYLN
jgi:cytochrome P450